MHYESPIQTIPKPFEPVSDAYLRSWTDYIQSEKAAGDVDRVIFLFEKALNALFFLPEIWLKYFIYLETEAARPAHLEEMFSRYQPVLIHLNPEVLLYGIYFEESQGRIAKVRDFFAYFRKHKGIVLEVILQEIYFEARQLSLEKAKTLLEEGFAGLKDVRQQLFLLQEVASFHAFLHENAEAGWEMLKSARRELKGTKEFYYLSFDFAFKCNWDVANKLRNAHSIFNEFLLEHTRQMSEKDQRDVWKAYIDLVSKGSKDPLIIKSTVAAYHNSFGRFLRPAPAPAAESKQDYGENPRKMAKLS
eukprot:TRINITY_DN2456_c0_g5_i1.p1 TRINITY_DN2456_c0_g5~~TRINITY_DN2456_c0_g5_i1.p1  ORF type:complete len:304 (+),score=42.94 TRINITY_DN2456_c0_g5_i1:557-1468(+)